MSLSIYENKAANLRIDVQTQAPQAVIDLLQTMVWGTNGPRYTKRGIEDKVEKLINPHFFLLKKSETIIGICALSERQIWLDAAWTKSYYVRHFCMHPDYQGHGYSKLLIEQLKNYFTSILPPPYVGYAFIEGRNIRSQKVARFIDYPVVRHFDSVLFSRLFPKKHPNVRLAKPEEYPHILKLLKDFYKSYNFVHFTKTFYKNRYVVYEENGEIIAGVQAHRVEWRVHQLSGAWTDKFLLNALPYLPIANRIFHPEYRFLAFSSIYCKAGREAVLLDLFESSLKMSDVYAALMLFDEECQVYTALQQLNQWGLMRKIQAPISASVVMNGYGFSEEELAEVCKKPAYIAAFDCL